MLIGSLVELHVGLHLCLCFSHLEKLFLKSLARHLLDTSSIAGYLSSFLKLFLIAISPAPRYLVDLSRLDLYARQLLDTWWIDRASVLKSSVLILDTSSTPQLSTSISSTPPRQISRYLSIPTSVKNYWLSYIKPMRDPVFISIDLSLDISLFLSQNHSNLTPILVLKDFPRFFKFFFTW